MHILFADCTIFVYVFIKMKSCMKTLEKIYADKLLKIKAIKLQPSNPFTWASGWKSPFYLAFWDITQETTS